MTIPNEARSISMRAIARITERVTGRTGIDKARWLRLVERYMSLFEPFVDRSIKAGASRKYYHDLIEEYIRSSKNAAVENLTDLEKIKAKLQTENSVVQVKGADGLHVAKPLKACTAFELDTLAEQYERSAASDARRARHYRFLAQQMRLAGLADADPLSRLIA